MSSGAEDRGLEDPCPSCGAMVRRGLVRCWDCGAFMRQEIEATYKKMQSGRSDVEFRPLPETTTSRSKTAIASVVADDDGFELASDGDFEIGESQQSSSTKTRRGASAFTGVSKGSEAAKVPSEDKKDKPSASSKSQSESKGASDAAGQSSASDSKSPEDAKAEKRKALAGDNGPSHSEATGGDALLQVALQEERETGRHGRRTAIDPVRVEGGWMITCPCPARVRIRVKPSHCGKTGKCPNPSCGSYFTVPASLAADIEQEPAETVDSAVDGLPSDPAEKAGPYTHWLRDVRLHLIKPAKAKRKPNGHNKEAITADVGFSKQDGLAVIALTAKPSGLLGKAKKPEQLRDDFLASLRSGTAVKELPSSTLFVISPEELKKAIVEYPPAYEHESTFAGIPVLGAGYIAVKLPPVGAEDEQQFLALTLTQFRRLQELLEGLFDVDQLGFACPIPNDDDVVKLVCHYSEDELSVLRNPTFHIADPEITLETVGYRCESCGLIVSENSRKKEKIGGLDGKKLSSAKCPKCKGKFGNSPLYALVTAPVVEGEASSAEPEASESASEAE